MVSAARQTASRIHIEADFEKTISRLMYCKLASTPAPQIRFASGSVRSGGPLTSATHSVVN